MYINVVPNTGFMIEFKTEKSFFICGFVISQAFTFFYSSNQKKKYRNHGNRGDHVNLGNLWPHGNHANQSVFSYVVDKQLLGILTVQLKKGSQVDVMHAPHLTWG